jgi:oligoribonuclease NrnB/cAMP/cGMP phosphodiesterase (DHH superfamily)
MAYSSYRGHPMAKVYHLSHTDLDGYSCQYVANEYFDDIEFYNTNYGNEISENFKKIMYRIFLSRDKEATILITDVNITLDQAKTMQQLVNGMDKKIELVLLDHHKSGAECAQKYEWYYLDDSRCATKITYEYLAKKYSPKPHLEPFVDVVNAVDIWLENDTSFEMGKVLMKLIASTKEINKTLFDVENRTFIFYLLKQCFDYFDKENGHIALDDALHKIRKSYFLKEKNDTLDNLLCEYVVSLLTQKKEMMQISYKDKKGILTYSIGNVSVVGNLFLIKNEDVDFFMDITSRKTFGLRAKGAYDVSVMAKEIGNGGGHANAAGGILSDFKDTYLYENIKQQVEEILAQKEKKYEQIS